MCSTVSTMITVEPNLKFDSKCHFNSSSLTADTRICQTRKTRLIEKSTNDITAFCTQKPQILNPLNLQYVYRTDNVTGIYRLSRSESHICYDNQVLPNMTNPAQLFSGKYYEIVYGTL